MSHDDREPDDNDRLPSEPDADFADGENHMLPEQRAFLRSVAQKERANERKKAPKPERKLPSDCFKSGSDVELGRHLATSLGDLGDVVVAEGAVWAYDGKLWGRVDEVLIAQLAQDYEGKPCEARKPSGEVYERRLALSNSAVEGIIKQCKVFLCNPRFFADAPVGIAFRNVFARVDGDRIIMEPITREHRVRDSHCMPYDLDETTDRPVVFDRLLEQTWAGCDDYCERVTYLLEWFGAALSGQTHRWKDSPFLYGKQDTGKSQLLWAIATCFPASARSSVNLHDMSIEHYRARMVGMLLNVVNELPSGDLVGSEPAKAILSGDELEVRRMRENPFTWVPRTACIQAANLLPRSKDKAFMGRFVLLSCNNVVPDEEKDRELKEKLTAEAPLIARVALEALVNLLKRRRFIRPSSSYEAASVWNVKSDPVLAWSVECCEQTDDCRTAGKDLYEHYRTWADDNGHKRMASNLFGERLEAVGEVVKMRSNGSRWNLKIRDDYMPTQRTWTGNGRDWQG